MIGDTNQNDFFSAAERYARLRLIRSGGIGPINFIKMIEEHGSAVNAVTFMENNSKLLPKSVKLSERGTLERELQTLDDCGAKLLFWGNPDYPALLSAIADPPPVITVRGDLELLNKPAIGVVGPRHASAAGLKITKQLCDGLSKAGVIIVSGMARGIDTKAHIAGLETGTIACLAGGIDNIYPPENTELYQKIAEIGLLVSEMAIGDKPQASHFPRRNRIISGLCQGLLVVEAAQKSGSLISARFAGEQGRDVFAVPGSPLDPRAYGTNKLIRDGAVLTRSAQDILDEIHFNQHITTPKNQMKSGPRVQPQQTLPLSTPIIASSIMDFLSPNPIHIDEIIQLVGKQPEIILAELLPLEIEGKILRHSGNRFSCISTKNE